MRSHSSGNTALSGAASLMSATALSGSFLMPIPDTTQQEGSFASWILFRAASPFLRLGTLLRYLIFGFVPFPLCTENAFFHLLQLF